MESKFWEDVVEGEQLPELKFGPLTIKSFMLMFAGTRDISPQHHNREWCQSSGSRDIFATTPWHQALFSRMVTDWSGPGSDFRATTLQMGIQVCPGDTVVISGEVVKKYQEGDDCRVDIDMKSESQLGVAGRATATIAMPSRERGEVKVLQDVDKLAIEPHPEMPEWAKPGLGIVSPKSGPTAYPITEIQLSYWADMVENSNPLYTDLEFAKTTRHKGIVAPGPSLMVWTFGRPGQSADVDNPDHVPFPPVAASQQGGATGRIQPPDAPFVLATQAIHRYGVPMRPGDVFYQTSELVNCSPLKRTHLGLGYFMTNMTTYYNQKDEIAANTLFTLYHYRTDDSK